MAENFYTMLTIVGKNKLSSSAVSGSKVNFKTLKVGDGKGAYYEPSENQTSLVNQVWEGNISSISIDENNSNWIVVETVIPASDGGFFIREAGIFDEDGDMIAISKLAETYKPVVAEGSTKDLVIRIVLEVLNVDTVTIKIDPNVVAATKNDVQVLEAKFEDVSAQLSDLAKDISNDVVLTQSIDYGMNNVIKNNGETSILPDFTIQGKTLINLLGKDGNCEDISKWALYQATSALDSTNKVFGSNGIKVTLTSTGGSLNNAISKYNIDITKYYLISAYLKNGNATNVSLIKDNGGGGTNKSISIIDTTKFNRVGLVIQPSDFASGNYIDIALTGTSGQYAYVDGIMINEITSAEYALGATALLANYPYVDSYTCLQNPYIEVRHDNLVRNGNGEEGVAWWTSSNVNGTLSIANGQFQLVTSSSGGCSYLQKINVKTNTSYYLSGTASGNTTLGVLASDSVTSLLNGVGTFNSGINSFIYISMNNASASQTGTASNIMLIEGTTTLTSYKSCTLERVVLETKLTSDDSITYENGEVTGLINWKHPAPLYGKDYDWQFGSDGTGFKQIILPSMFKPNGVSNSQIGVKYNGKILNNGKSSSTSPYLLPGGDYIDYDITYVNPVQISMFDSDTGWAETISPNNDEVKAFMNGWKAIACNGIRYVAWVSIVDNSLPSAVNSTTVANAYTSGSTTMVVADGTKFSVGDEILVSNGTTQALGLSIISNISGNTLTVTIGIGYNISVGALVYRCDNGSNDTRILNYCKNNVSPNYEGYQLHYKLQNPEPITDDNCHINGDIPKFDIGDNYLFLDSGGVLGEIANPVWNGGGAYFINSAAIQVASDKLKYKTEDIFTVYKNNIYNNNVWNKFVLDGLGNGNVYVNTANANYDTTATYTVDYKILATQAPQIGTIGCSYSQDISSAINDLQEEINNRQEHDSILDEIVDLSLYEKINTGGYADWSGVNYLDASSVFYVQVKIPFSVIKKVIPLIVINKLMIGYGSSSIDVTSKFNLNSMRVSTNNIVISWSTTDTSTITNIKSQGVRISYDIIADCRGRI